MGACASKNGQNQVEIRKTTIVTPPVPKVDLKGAVPTREDELNFSTDDVWDDDAIADASTVVPSPDPNQQRRRRLSVSTIETQQPKAALVRGELTSDVAMDAKGNKTARTRITKFPDPALELVDRERSAVKEVTLKMLNDLFPEAEHYAVFGSPSYDIQRGFDNKESVTGGVMPPGKSLKDIGVAYACKKGLKPESPNQDDFFVLRVDDWAMYGVFDGHGPCGHDISAFVHKTLPFLILSDPEFESNLNSTLRRAFWRVHHLVEAAAEQAGSHIDCSLSGTTATVAVHRDGKLTVAHVGDSRAVLAQRRDGRYIAKNLTHDHKPTSVDERTRIENAGGEVRRLEGDVPYRVFVRNRMYPGLAMSRAIGDVVGVAVGVTPDPDIKTWTLQANDRFFIIATDGVWEFISSQQAVDIVSVKRMSQANEGAELLAYESWRRWVEEEENVVDDVTCIVVWLDTEGLSTSKRKDDSISRYGSIRRNSRQPKSPSP